MHSGLQRVRVGVAPISRYPTAGGRPAEPVHWSLLSRPAEPVQVSLLRRPAEPVQMLRSSFSAQPGLPLFLMLVPFWGASFLLAASWVFVGWLRREQRTSGVLEQRNYHDEDDDENVDVNLSMAMSETSLLSLNDFVGCSCEGKWKLPMCALSILYKCL